MVERSDRGYIVFEVVENSSRVLLSDVYDHSSSPSISEKFFHVGELVSRVLEVDASIVNIDDSVCGISKREVEELFPDGEGASRERGERRSFSGEGTKSVDKHAKFGSTIRY